MAAALLVMLLAPAIHQRVVLYTENRLKATMPLSPQEIRAQKDMVRALYAAENARTTHELTREREKSLALKLSNETLGSEASRLVADNQEHKSQINEMSTEAADLRSKLRRAEVDASNVRETLKRTEIAAAAKDLELDELARRIGRIMAEIDSMRIEAISRDTEIDVLKTRVQSMRDEREELRRENKLLVKRAKDAEIRLTQEEHKALRLDDHLSRKMADRADLETSLDRRTREAAELKTKLKVANAQLRTAFRALKQADLPVPDIKDLAMTEDNTVAARVEAMPAPVEPGAIEPAPVDPERLAEEIRARQAALTDRLLRAKATTEDNELRDELSDIAAKMIVLTATTEGPSSPISDLLGSAQKSGAQKSLVDRVVAMDPNLGRGQASRPSPAE
jgi:chromosome segregation ATPase